MDKTEIKERGKAISQVASPAIEELNRRLNEIAQPGATMETCTIIAEAAEGDSKKPTGAIWFGSTALPDKASVLAEMLIPVLHVVQAQMGLNDEQFLDWIGKALKDEHEPLVNMGRR